MVEDASLDDFLDAGDDQQAGTSVADENASDGAADSDTAVDADGTSDDAGAGDQAAGEEPDDANEESDDAAVDPATVDGASATYDWSPDGVACEACGTTVERRWHDESGLVCTECKEW